MLSATDQLSDAHDAPLTLGVSAAVTAEKTREASSLAAAQAVARRPRAMKRAAAGLALWREGRAG